VLQKLRVRRVAREIGVRQDGIQRGSTAGRECCIRCCDMSEVCGMCGRGMSYIQK
jgi:hypothetical protein